MQNPENFRGFVLRHLLDWRFFNP